MDRILGIDYGDSRIGIAMSDVFGWTAQGLCVVNAKQKRENVINELIKIIDQNKIKKIVFGYPLNMDGTKGSRALITDVFAMKLLESKPDLELVKWDERLTSVAANKAMREMGVSQKVKGVNDMIAAIFILQGYLDSISNK